MYDAINDLVRWCREGSETAQLREAMDFYEVHQKWAPDTVDRMTLAEARRQHDKIERYFEATKSAMPEPDM